MKKFKPREVNVIDFKKVIMLCGECPGNMKKNSTNDLVFMEMRTGTFVRELVKDSTNLILTNAYNYLTNNKEERLRAQAIGKIELMDLIEQYKPVKIVALGDYAYKTLLSLPVKLNVVKLYHPSYVLRFALNIYSYKAKLLGELSIT